MKKLIALALLALTFCFALVGCDGDEEDPPASTNGLGTGSEVFIVDFEDLFPAE